MEEIFQFLKKLPANFVGTVGADGGANMRPFGDPVWFDGKMYCLTHKSKNVYKETLANNQICICALDGDDKWLRVRGRLVDDSENIEAKKAIIAEFDWAEEAGYTLDNPDFACLYLDDVNSAEVRDAEGDILEKYL